MTETPIDTSLGCYGNIVPEGYTYSQKLVTPGDDLHLPHAYLKWYDIYPPDREIAPEHVRESRDFAAAEVERLRLSDELGFVLLHACGPALLLMLITCATPMSCGNRSTRKTWRNREVASWRQRSRRAIGARTVSGSLARSGTSATPGCASSHPRMMRRRSRSISAIGFQGWYNGCHDSPRRQQRAIT